MNKFRIRDTVRVIAPRCRWFDQVGTVHDVAAGQFHVLLETGLYWFRPDELVLAEYAGDGS